MKKWRRVWRCVLSMRAILLSTGKVLSLNDDGDNLDCEVDSSISWEWNDSLDKISDFEEKLYWCPAGTAILKVSFQVHQALRTITATTVNSVQDLRHQIKVKERNLKQKANREKGILIVAQKYRSSRTSIPVPAKQRRPGTQTKTKTLIKKHQANGSLEACKSRSNRSC